MHEFCPHCGNRLAQDETRCGQCRTAQADIWCERTGGDVVRFSAEVEPATPGTPARPNRLARLAAVGTVAILLALVVTNIFPAFEHTGNMGPDTACKSNLTNIGTACEMYSTDNHGLYPHNLAVLTPNYLKTIPTCPNAGDDTYTKGYAWAARPDAYTVVCFGRNHADVSDNANYPQYTSTQGLLEK